MANKTVVEILEERQSTHGTFEESATTVQRIKTIMRGTPNWDKLSNAQREALEMIQHKIGRILHGDPYLLDSVRDIIGYAQLVYDELESKDGSTDVKTERIARVNGCWVNKA